MSDTDETAHVFSAPDTGGWYYTSLRDWIAVCPDISPTAVQLYWIIRSLMHEKGNKSRRLSLDQLAWLMPGVNGKPTSATRVKTAVRELTTVGLLSNPDGDVQRRWITNPETGKQTRENFRRWQVHDYPADDYTGYRNTLAKLDDYSPDWRSQLVDNSERRNSASQSDAPPPPAQTQETPGHAEGRNSASMGRNSASMGRNSVDSDAHTSKNRGFNKPPQPTDLNNHPPHARTREAADDVLDDVGGVDDSSVNGGGISGLAGEVADAMSLDNAYSADADTDAAELDSARRLLRALRAQDGEYLSNQAVREFTPVIVRLRRDGHTSSAITDHVTSGIRSGGGLRHRLTQLRDGHTSINTGNPASISSLPPLCGSCDNRFIEQERADGDVVIVRCPNCHPARIAA